MQGRGRCAGRSSRCTGSNLMAWKGSPFVKDLFVDDPTVPTRRPWSGQAFDGQEGAATEGLSCLHFPNLPPNMKPLCMHCKAAGHVHWFSQT